MGVGLLHWEKNTGGGSTNLQCVIDGKWGPNPNYYYGSGVYKRLNSLSYLTYNSTANFNYLNLYIKLTVTWPAGCKDTGIFIGIPNAMIQRNGSKGSFTEGYFYHSPALTNNNAQTQTIAYAKNILLSSDLCTYLASDPPITFEIIIYSTSSKNLRDLYINIKLLEYGAFYGKNLSAFTNTTANEIIKGSVDLNKLGCNYTAGTTFINRASFTYPGVTLTSLPWSSGTKITASDWNTFWNKFKPS